MSGITLGPNSARERVTEIDSHQNKVKTDKKKLQSSSQCPKLGKKLKLSDFKGQKKKAGWWKERA